MCCWLLLLLLHAAAAAAAAAASTTTAVIKAKMQFQIFGVTKTQDKEKHAFENGWKKVGRFRNFQWRARRRGARRRRRLSAPWRTPVASGGAGVGEM